MESMHFRSVLNHLFEFLDRHDTGSVESREFVPALLSLTRIAVIDRLAVAFRLFDITNSGTIRLEELSLYMTCFLRSLLALHPGELDRDTLEREISMAILEICNSFSGDDITHRAFNNWFKANEKNLPKWLTLF